MTQTHDKILIIDKENIRGCWEADLIVYLQWQRTRLRV